MEPMSIFLFLTNTLGNSTPNQSLCWKLGMFLGLQVRLDNSRIVSCLQFFLSYRKIMFKMFYIYIYINFDTLFIRIVF